MPIVIFIQGEDIEAGKTFPKFIWGEQMMWQSFFGTRERNKSVPLDFFPISCPIRFSKHRNCDQDVSAGVHYTCDLVDRKMEALPQ